MLAAASAIATFVIGVLTSLGPIAAPLAGMAMTAPATAVAGTTIAGLAGTGSAAGGAASLGAGGAAVGANEHAATGVQNGINDAINQAKDGAAGSINDLNIPGVPHLSFN